MANNYFILGILLAFSLSMAYGQSTIEPFNEYSYTPEYIYDSSVIYLFNAPGDSSRYATHHYQYDQDDRVVVSAYYDWSETPEYGYFKETYDYDQYGNIVKHIIHYWDENTNDWYQSLIDSLGYNANQLCDYLYQKCWSEDSNRWIPNARLYQSFNADHQPTEYYELYYNDTTDVFDTSLYAIDRYNADGKLRSSVVYDWDQGSQSLNNQTIYAYDTLGLDKVVYTGTSIIDGRREFVYNGSVYDTLETAFMYMGSNWDTTDIYKKKYNAEGELTEKIHMQPSFGNGTKYVYSYNSKGNVIERICYDWDSSTDSWKLADKDVYNYDGADRLKCQSWYMWDEGSGAYVIEDKTYYYYSGTTNRPGEMLLSGNASIQFAPNPAKDIVRVQPGTAKILQVKGYDLTGKLCFEINNTAVLDLSSQKSGIYLLEIRTCKGTHHQRLIIE